MAIAGWEFKPGLWPTVATLLVLPLLLALGFWQVQRGDEKQRIHERFQAQLARPVADIDAAVAAAEPLIWRHLRLHGGYEPAPQFLLDNRVRAGRAGYFVYTPWLLADGTTRVLVNRGWLAAGTDRTQSPAIPPPPATAIITGLAKYPPRPGLRLATAPAERLAPGVRRVQELDLAAIGRDNHWQLLPFVLRREAPDAEGFIRQWPLPGSGRERHLGYAFQWFAMAAALLVIFVLVNLQRVKRCS